MLEEQLHHRLTNMCDIQDLITRLRCEDVFFGKIQKDEQRLSVAQDELVAFVMRQLRTNPDRLP